MSYRFRTLVSTAVLAAAAALFPRVTPRGFQPRLPCANDPTPRPHHAALQPVPLKPLRFQCEPPHPQPPTPPVHPNRAPKVRTYASPGLRGPGAITHSEFAALLI
jgi:hypothetical protein